MTKPLIGSMVVTPKSNGKVRVCVNLSKLNEYVKRENYPLAAVDTLIGRLAGSRVFEMQAHIGSVISSLPTLGAQ